jgi:hypothetical protein
MQYLAHYWSDLSPDLVSAFFGSSGETVPVDSTVCTSANVGARFVLFFCWRRFPRFSQIRVDPVFRRLRHSACWLVWNTRTIFTCSSSILTTVLTFKGCARAEDSAGRTCRKTLLVGVSSTSHRTRFLPPRTRRQKCTRYQACNNLLSGRRSLKCGVQASNTLVGEYKIAGRGSGPLDENRWGPESQAVCVPGVKRSAHRRFL